MVVIKIVRFHCFTNATGRLRLSKLFIRRKAEFILICSLSDVLAGTEIQVIILFLFDVIDVLKVKDADFHLLIILIQ